MGGLSDTKAEDSFDKLEPLIKQSTNKKSMSLIPVMDQTKIGQSTGRLQLKGHTRKTGTAQISVSQASEIHQIERTRYVKKESRPKKLRRLSSKLKLTS